MDWSKFDKKVDLDGLEEDLKEVEENGGGDYPEIPNGAYEVQVQKLELKESSKGDPMLSVWFEILEGEYKGQLIFSNTVMQPSQPSRTFAFQIHNALVVLRKLWDAEDDEVQWDGSFDKLNDLIKDIAADVVENEAYQYQLTQSDNKKKPQYKDLEIEIFDEE